MGPLGQPMTTTLTRDPSQGVSKPAPDREASSSASGGNLRTLCQPIPPPLQMAAARACSSDALAKDLRTDAKALMAVLKHAGAVGSRPRCKTPGPPRSLITKHHPEREGAGLLAVRRHGGLPRRATQSRGMSPLLPASRAIRKTRRALPTGSAR